MTADGRNVPAVQVIGPTDGWILERLARRLAGKLPYATFVPNRPQEIPGSRIAYYVNYALFHEPSGLVDVGLFTHFEDQHAFLERARQMDFCVSMSALYADWLQERGVAHVEHVPMGCDFYRFRPKLVLVVVGRLEHPRKGAHLVAELKQLHFVEIVTTEGRVAEQNLADVYQRCDYVLIPATVEGGPLCLLEGLAMGKPVIAPEGVGMVGEFPDTPYILRYPAGDGEALQSLVRRCFEQKQESRRLVADRTWDDWAAGHDRLFRRLAAEQGEPMPDPAPGFRFGLMGELELDPGADAAAIESEVDLIARSWFHGRYTEVRRAVVDLARRVPSAERWLHELPDDASESSASAWESRAIRPVS